MPRRTWMCGFNHLTSAEIVRSYYSSRTPEQKRGPLHGSMLHVTLASNCIYNCISLNGSLRKAVVWREGCGHREHVHQSDGVQRVLCRLKTRISRGSMAAEEGEEDPIGFGPVGLVHAVHATVLFSKLEGSMCSVLSPIFCPSRCCSLGVTGARCGHGYHQG